MSSEGGDRVDFVRVVHKVNLSDIWPKKSHKVIKHMIETEQIYVTDLDNIVKVSIMWNNV